MASLNLRQTWVAAALAVLLATSALQAQPPAAPAGWSDGYVIANGIRIHYWRSGGDKPVLILAHGSSDDGLCWTNLAKELEQDFDIIMPDARGHGLSDPPSKTDSADVQAEDLAGLIDALKLEKPILMGHSMGSASVAWLAAKYPDLPGAVILEDPRLIPRPPGDPRLNATAEAQEKRRLQIVQRNNMTYDELVADCMKRNPQWGKSECECWAPSKRLHHPNTAYRRLGDRPPMSELFQQITAPTLILKADAEADEKQQNEEVASLLQRGKIVHVKGARHNVRRDQKVLLLAALNPFLASLVSGDAAESIPEFKWREVEIDTIQIGYGLQLTDVNGDGKTDIVLADKSSVQWYENPNWTKHVIARDLTKRDNVCITARDIDGDGMCEIAVGGQWNFRESIKDGAVHYLIPPTDRRQPWTPVELHHEPSVHRMHWVKGKADQFQLVVKPLRGRGSVDGEGAGLRVLEYTKPADPTSQWKYDVVCDFIHLSHNFHPVNWDDDAEEELIIAGKEGVWYFDRQDDDWSARQLTENFAGEIRDGRLPNGKRFIVTIEPMHGSKSAVYVEPAGGGGLWQPIKVLDEALKDGHALACADYLGVGSDQIVVGWRAMNAPGIPGIKLFTPLDGDGSSWRETRISADKVAVEDIKAADLNGDGRVDIVAAARQTKNLVIFFNER